MRIIVLKNIEVRLYTSFVVILKIVYYAVIIGRSLIINYYLYIAANLIGTYRGGGANGKYNFEVRIIYTPW